MEAFYEKLAQHGLGRRRLTQRGAEKLIQWDRKQLIDFCEDVHPVLPTAGAYEDFPFGFVASKSLSGGEWPCSAFSCRMSSIDNLARFAALYADTVLIPDPFFEFIYDPDRNIDYIRTELAANIAFAHVLRPLIEKGLISYAPAMWAFCSECANKFSTTRSDLDRILGKVVEELRYRYVNEVEYIAESNGAEAFVEVRGPEELIEHGTTFIHFRRYVPDYISERLKKRSQKLNKRERLRIAAPFINSIIQDTQLQSYYVNLWHKSYLTDHEASFRAIVKSEDRTSLSHVSEIVEGLSHAVPISKEMELKDLLKFRFNNQESFNVYRDSLVKSISRSRAHPSQSKEIFSDILRPEINRINLLFSNYKLRARSEVIEKASISSALVGVGLFSGLLPSNIGEIVAAIGGFHFLSSAAEKIHNMAKEPASIKDERYYFLWKMQK